MKKVIVLALGILFITTPICLNQAGAASANHGNGEQAEVKRLGGKPKAPKKVSKKKTATGRCQKPTDRDAKGRLCGKRAASEKKGGN
jgi:hypothetical protein